ncbi:xanthine dehydrogenase family protein molybdopterin-binding subunit [Novosphingobium soli]|uniref:Molybdopterin cofactor-binding domain-containing protein n=1 Tax=Novosphingobium soli TaxID=574956 RepID=A0ABV6CV45_9SPHN
MAQPHLSRRTALGGAFGGAFTLAFPRGVAQALAGEAPVRSAEAAAGVELQPLITVLPDGRIRIAALLAEMGQGVSTAMPLILADELDADWDRVEIVPIDSTMRIPTPHDPGMLIAASSRSIRSWFSPLREVAARGRLQLAAAAAAQWGVAPGECRTARGRVIHPDGRTSLDYGALAAAAAQVALPGPVALKSPDQFTLIGKVGGRRDVPGKVTGAAIYASDVKLPGLLHASVAQGPFGAVAIASYQRAAALADPRVRDLFVIDGTTLVALAQDTWSAMKALDAAAPVFDTGPTSAPSSAAYKAALIEALDGQGRAFAVTGEAPAPNGLTVVEADYTVAFLAHATMEPMSCTAWFHEGRLEVWAPTQAVFRALDVAAQASGLAKEAVVIHQTLLGGGFGRRSEQDFVAQAVQIAMRARAPVRLQWSRAEDTKRDYYRSAYAMRCKGAVDSAGAIADYGVTIAGPSILRTRMALFDGPKAPIDPTAQNGLVPEFYRLPATRAAWVEVRPPVPVGYWRSVAHSQNLFPAESFIDELAHAAGKDPFDFRQAHVTDPRMAAVMTKLRSLSEWDGPLPPGRARGVAVVACYESYFGQVIELSVSDGEVHVHRATSVIDCGLAVQPDNIVAQVEGGTIFGLSAALYGEIEIEDGVTQQSSFSDYRVLLLPETPQMRTHVMPSTAAPGGVGETGTPCAMPATANALFALTGKRLRSLPLHKALLG